MNRKYAVCLGVAGLTIALAAPASGQQAAPGNMNILIICGDENGTYAKCTSLDDRSLELHLRLNLGQQVTMMPDDTAEADMRAAADAADLIIIPESVNSGSVGTKLIAASSPLINMEAFLQDEFQFVDPEGQSVDPGSPEGGAGGTVEEPPGAVAVGRQVDQIRQMHSVWVGDLVRVQPRAGAQLHRAHQPRAPATSPDAEVKRVGQRGLLALQHLAEQREAG